MTGIRRTCKLPVNKQKQKGFEVPKGFSTSHIFPLIETVLILKMKIVQSPKYYAIKQ